MLFGQCFEASQGLPPVSNALRQDSLQPPLEQFKYDNFLNYMLRMEAIGKYVQCGATRDIRQLIFTPSYLNELINYILRHQPPYEFYHPRKYKDIISLVCSSNYQPMMLADDLDVFFDEMARELAYDAQKLHPSQLNYLEPTKRLLDESEQTIRESTRQHAYYKQKNQQGELTYAYKQLLLQNKQEYFDAKRLECETREANLYKSSQNSEKISRVQESRITQLSGLYQKTKYYLNKLKDYFVSEQKRLSMIQKYINNDIPKDIYRYGKYKVASAEQIRQYQEKKHMVADEIMQYYFKKQDLEQEKTDYAKKQEKRDYKMQLIQAEFLDKMERLYKDAVEDIDQYMQQFFDIKEAAESLRRGQRDIEALMARNTKLKEEIEKLRVRGK